MRTALATSQTSPSRQANSVAPIWPRLVPLDGRSSAHDGLDDDLNILQSVGHKLRFARNETIFLEGDPADSAYKVVSGAVRLCRHMADGRRQVADFRLEGDFFGLWEPGEYSLTAEAASDTVVIAYPRRQLERMGEETPSLRKRLLMLLCGRVTAMQNHLVMLGRQTAKERIASFLVVLVDRAEAMDGDRVELPMTRQDMADYSGLTIETVCRLLSALKRKRIIDLPNLHQFVINDVEALRELADCDS